MDRQLWRLLYAPFLGVSLCCAVSVYVQGSTAHSQTALAQQVLSEDRDEASRALVAVELMTEAEIGRTLRAALFALVEREAAIRRQRAAAAKRGEVLESIDNENYFTAAGIVARLNDPAALPTLVGSMSTGLTVTRAVAAFGPSAVPSIASVVSNDASPVPQVTNGLIALRLILEDSSRIGPRLTSAEIDTITDALRPRLTRAQSVETIYVRALDLAGALGDPELLSLVEAMANDRSLWTDRGVDDASLIDDLQVRAATALNKGRRIVPSEPPR